MKNRIIYSFLALVTTGAVLLYVGGNKIDRCLFSFTCAQPQISFKNLEQTSNIMPLAIIGSGPAGLSAGMYGARFGIDTYILMGNEPGGLLMKTTGVENWPGKLTALGSTIMADLQKQAEHSGAHLIYDEVVEADFSVYPYKLITQDKKVYHALSVLIATGAVPILPTIEGLNEYWAKGVSSCAVCDAPFYKNKNVVVIGGGDSAIEEAIQLVKCKQVTILVRKDRMRASQAMQERLKGYPNINVLYSVEVKAIEGDAKGVNQITIFDNKNNKTYTMPISAVFLATGHKPNTEFLKNGQIELDSEGYIVLHGRTQSVLRKGSHKPLRLVYAAGDVEDKEYRQAGVAASSGIKAAMEASKEFIDAGYNALVAQRIKGKLATGGHELQNASLITLIPNDEQFKEAIKNGIVIADFFTDGCSQCTQMLPFLEELAVEYSDIKFVKADSDELPEASAMWSIMSVPALLIFKDGNLVARKNAFMKKSDLKKFIKAALNK